MTISDMCRVCGGKRGHKMQSGDCDYFRCSSCRTLQKSLTLQQYNHMDPGYDPGAYFANLGKAEIRAQLNVEMRRAFLEEMLANASLSAKGKSFLDIGCGMGAYMLAARDMGMSVMGFEPSVSHGNVAKNVLNLPVTSDYFSSGKVHGQGFDVIMLSHVIEHIYDPKAFILDIVSVLNPGGILIMVTPNADSLSARFTGSQWPMLVPIDHVTMMTKGSFEHLNPPGYKMHISTSEYPSEFFATLASIAKRGVAGRATNYADEPAAAAPKLMKEASWRSKAVRGALAVASFPFYVTSKLTDRQAALRVTVQKPAS